MSEVRVDVGEERLVRGLGPIALTGLGAGTVTGVGFLMMSGDIISNVGSWGLILSYAVGMIVEIIAMLATVSIASSYPLAGSVTAYARKVLRAPLIGFWAGVALWLGMVAIDGAELMAFGRYLYYLFPQIHYYWWGIIITVIFIIINLLGVVLTGRAQVVVSLTMWILLVSVPILVFTVGQKGGLLHPSYWAILKEEVGLANWMAAIFFGVYCYVGFVTILPAAEETINPEIRIPKAILLGALITGSLYITGGMAVTLLRPYQELLALAPEGPFASPWVKAMEVMWSGKGAIYMDIVAISTSLTTANACVYGGARMLYDMAKEMMLPGIFKKLSKYKVPPVPIIVTAFAILFCVVTGAIAVVSAIANFVFFPLWMMISLASLQNIRNAKREARETGIDIRELIPFYVPGGELWPLLSFIVSLILAIITFLATPEVVAGGIITIVFFAIVTVYYYVWKWYNLKRGIDIAAEAEKYEHAFLKWEEELEELEAKKKEAGV